MSTENLQSQIRALREKKVGLNARSGKRAAQDYDSLIESLEKMASSAEEELSRARSEIEAERQSFQNFFRFTQDAYFVTDAEGVITEANAASAILLGTALADLIGSPLSSHVINAEQSTFSLHVLEIQLFH